MIVVLDAYHRLAVEDEAEGLVVRCHDMPPTFTKDWDAPDALPAESVQNALALIRSGRLHRYQLPNSAQDGEVSKLEVEFARLMGTKYCSAVNSCGCGMFLALKGLLVGPGDIVFVNAHTLTPVPSSVVHCGATQVLVECTRSGVVDLAHLEAQIKSGQIQVHKP